MAEEMA